MSILSKLQAKKDLQTEAVQSRVEVYMMLIRVYYQSVMVVNLGITNINAAPDMALFKRKFKIPTLNGRLGTAEKTRSKKMLEEEYNLPNEFFVEIEQSVKKNCKKPQDVQAYLYLFQGFANDLMTLVGNLMQWKLRVPTFFRKSIYALTYQTMQDICKKEYFKKEDVMGMVRKIRGYNQKLHYSEGWMTNYVFPILMLAKNAKKPALPKK